MNFKIKHSMESIMYLYTSTDCTLKSEGSQQATSSRSIVDGGGEISSGR